MSLCLCLIVLVWFVSFFLLVSWAPKYINLIYLFKEPVLSFVNSLYSFLFLFYWFLLWFLKLFFVVHYGLLCSCFFRLSEFIIMPFNCPVYDFNVGHSNCKSPPSDWLQCALKVLLWLLFPLVPGSFYFFLSFFLGLFFSYHAVMCCLIPMSLCVY